MPILELAIPCPLRRSFDYRAPANAANLQPGMRVLAPFGNRRVVGILLAIKEHSDVDDSRLKSAIAILDEQPSLTPEILSLGLWASRYYQHPLGDCLQQALPARLRREKPASEAPVHCWQLTTEGEAADPESLARAPKQAQLLGLVQQTGFIDREQLRQEGLSPALAKALCERGLLQPASLEVGRNSTPRSTPPTLNDEQQHAVSTVQQSLGHFASFLLDGVTGSGKTEVYLRLIDACLQRGQQALVLIPEIGLSPQTLQRFQRRFEQPITALHSGLSDGDRLRGWEKARSGEARIVIGTRSAIFTPFESLGLVIVDEEHDLSYKQQDGFRYNARDLAVKRANEHSCPVVLGSATPSLESLHNVAQGRYRQLHLLQRAGDARPPSLTLVDVRDQTLQDGLGEQALVRIRSTLEQGNQALVFLNRRGFAPILQCHSCGWMADCRHCDARLTVHAGRRQLRCHHCDAVEALPDACPQCKHQPLDFRGPGTERLELALTRLFADTPVVRIDRDTTGSKAAMQHKVASIKQGQPCILVGTQMLAKGHHFPDVTTVVILDLDSGLFSADYRGAERTGQLLVQVAGRAGRAEKPGEVLIQTHCPEHPVLQTLIQQGYPAFARQLLEERALMQLPPYSYSALVRADAARLEQAERFLRQLSQALPERDAHWLALGPLPAPMTRKAGRYRATLLLQAQQRKQLHHLLHILIAAAEQQKNRGQLRWSVDVDPVDTL